MSEAQKRISIRDFDYDLPQERIAQEPKGKRNESKLLVYQNGEIEHSYFNEIGNWLPSDSLIIFNNTRVIPARIYAQKSTGAKIQLFLLQPETPYQDMERALKVDNESVVWQCMIGNAKKWKEGSDLVIATDRTEITATLENKANGLVRFEWSGNISFSDVIESIGRMPLPPYIKREAQSDDSNRYQTVYAKNDGAVAAPTAGLHFTDEIIEGLERDGHRIGELTLHVGAGTFKPVTEDKVWDHEMHSEFFQVPKETIENLVRANKRIATGTTSLRTLESLYWIGVKLNADMSDPFVIEQHLPYAIQHDTNFSYQEALKAILDYMEIHHLSQVSGSSGLMIMPGYNIRSIDGLITNFHMPKSTLLLLISAWIGDDWKEVYRSALDNDYRFLSYGDSSLLLKTK